MITINIAFTDRDGLVKDDYYKAGKAINRDITRKKNAENLGVTAYTQFDLQKGNITATLNKTYTGKIEQKINPGNWWVRISPENDSWYIEGRLFLPKESQVELK